MHATVSVEPVHRIADVAGIRRIAARGSRVSGDTVYRVWEDAFAATGDRALPRRVAETVGLDDLGPYGFAIMTAATVRDALVTAAECFGAVNAAGSWSSSVFGGAFELTWTAASTDRLGARLSSESVVAHFARGVRQLCGEDVAATVAPNVVRVPAHVLGVVPRMANANMHAFFRERCAVAAPLGARWIDRVDARIEDLLADGDASAEHVAAELGVSRRTLHRRLRERGTTYRERLERVRRSLAHRLVTDAARPLTEVAFDLGFADQASFCRAFRRWFGHTPSEWRAGPQCGLVRDPL